MRLGDNALHAHVPIKRTLAYPWNLVADFFLGITNRGAALPLGMPA